MKTLEALDIYFKQKKLSPYTKANMTQTFTELSQFTPELPESAFKINEFLASRTQSPTSVQMKRRHIISIYHLLADQLDFPDFTKKIMKIKAPKSKRRYLSAPQLGVLFSKGATTPMEKGLLLLLIGSPCRIGELGRHPLPDGSIYPGLRTEMISEPFTITEDGKSKLVCTLNLKGKTGEASYSCLPEVRDYLMGIAAPNGQVFTTTQAPNGVSSMALGLHVREMFIRAGLQGKKMGPHTIRHSSATIIARLTGSVLAVMSALQQTETKSAMGYIHDAQDELKHHISPLQIIGDAITGKQHETFTPKQLMITDGSTPPPNQPENTLNEVEHVEGQVDISEDLFANVPEYCKPIRPMLDQPKLLAMRKAFVYYSRTAPLDGTTGQLAKLWKSFFKYA